MKWFCLLIFSATVLAGQLPAAETNVSVSILDGNILCLRAALLSKNSPDPLRALQPTNRLVGVVLDLRFADGDTVADAEKILAAKKIRLVLLVNGQTRGAAAELARRLRGTGAGLVIGSTNLPGAMIPDITVDVPADAEKKFQENPFAVLSIDSATPFSKSELVPFVDHMSEAELVHRKIKDGEDFDDPDLTPRVAPPQPIIRDPALARAVDLLKALAALKPARG